MISPDPSAVFRRLESGGVILTVESGAYFQVNSSGRLIWELSRTVWSVTTSLRPWLSTSTSTTKGQRADIDVFLRQLDERSLIDIGE